MPQTFVPNVTTAILPAVRYQYRMHRSPAHFGVPEPKRCFRGGVFAPSLDMRFVPFCKRFGLMIVAGKTVHAIRTIGENASRSRPVGIQLFRAVKVNGHMAASVQVANHRFPL